MPTSKPSAAPSGSPAAPDGLEPEQPASAADSIRARADALFRTALECCRQHERFTHVVRLSTVAAEQRTATEACGHCDEALENAVAAYEKCTARTHPNGDDEAWWHRANGLWHASREYLRRHDGCDKLSRRIDGQANGRASARLGELQMQYELEASALLALQQATDAYRKVRPEAW